MGDEVAQLDDLDPDAPWKPGFEWSVPATATSSPGSFAPREGATAPPDGPDPWSRAAAEQPISWKDWVPPPELRRQSRTPRVATAPQPAVVTIDGSPAPAVTGDLVLAGVVVLAMVTIAVFSIISLVRVADSPAVATPDVLPATAEPLWSATIGRRAGTAATGDGVVVVDAREQVEAFEARTGLPLWTLAVADHPLSRDLRVIDGVALVVDRTGRATHEIVAVDARSGEPLWSRSEQSDVVRIVDDRLLEFGVAGRFKTLQRIEPRSGLPVGPRFDIGQATAPMPRITSVDGGRITVYDVDSGQRLGPTVDGPRLRSVDVVAGVVVGFDDAGRIVVFDEGGDRTDERPFTSDAFGEFRGRAELVGAVPGHDLTIVSSGSSIGFAAGDGSVDVVWQLDGRVGAPVETDIGPVSVARVIDAATGEVNHALVAATTGETIVVTDPGVTREAKPELRTNGYVVTPEVGRTQRVLEAYDFAGDRMWSVDLPVNASFELADAAVVVVHRDLDTTTLTVYG